MFARRAFALVLSVAFHGALALFLASRAWNPAPSNVGPSEPSLTVVDLSAPQVEQREPRPRPEPMQSPAAPDAASKARPVAQLVLLPAMEAMRQAEVPAPSEAAGQGQSPVAGSSPGAAFATSAGNANAAARAVPAASSPPGARGLANAEEAYGAEVHRWIERRKSFPANLAVRGFEGTVTVEFQIDRRGRLTGPVRIVASSGEPVLDRLAQQQIQAASPFPKPPAASSWKQRSFTLPMTYRPRA